MVAVYLVIGISIVLSYDWSKGAFMPGAWINILLGIVVAAIFYVVILYGRRGAAYFFPAAVCPACRKMIPADANLCPYCGQRLR